MTRHYFLLHFYFMAFLSGLLSYLLSDSRSPASSVTKTT